MKLLFVVSVINSRFSIDKFRESFSSLSAWIPAFEILFIDEAAESANSFYSKLTSGQNALPVKRLRTKTQIGPGAFRKLAYRHAVTNGFDYVMPLNWDNHTNLDTVPLLMDTMLQHRCDVVMGSDQRPLWKKIATITFLGIKRQSLSWILKKITKIDAICWPPRYLMFRVSALHQIPFELNANGPHFDFEVLLQLANQKSNLIQLDISNLAYRGLGMPVRPRLFMNILKAALKYRLMQYHLFFDIRYELAMDLHPINSAAAPTSVYEEKLASLSPHSLVCENNSLVPPHSNVLDIGCATGYLCHSLSQLKACTAEGVDRLPADQFEGGRNSTYHQIDLDGDLELLNHVFEASSCDVVLLLDVIEHLSRPEIFLINLYKGQFKQNPKFLISTGNVAFVVTRLMLLAGFFNYGKKGILDITHKRLFTLRNFKNLMEQTGFITESVTYFPLPFKSLGWPRRLAGFLEGVNKLLIKMSPSLFAYQVMVEATHLPSSTDWTDAKP